MRSSAERLFSSRVGSEAAKGRLDGLQALLHILSCETADGTPLDKPDCSASSVLGREVNVLSKRSRVSAIEFSMVCNRGGTLKATLACREPRSEWTAA